MKVFALIVALLIGITTAEWFIHRPADAAAQKAQKEKALEGFNNISEAAWAKMEEQYRDACRSHWLDQTGCFQVKGMKAEECVRLIERKCGTGR